MAESSEIIFSNPNFSNDFRENLSQLRAAEKFCDIKLRVSDKVIHAHKAILAISSSFFKETLFKENVDVLEKFDIETNFTVMSVIVDYMYTGTMKISMNNLRMLLRNIEYFKINFNLLDELINMPSNTFNVDNCIDMFLLAGELQNITLINKLADFISINLMDISNSNRFKMLSKDEVEIILDEIYALNPDEESMYQAVMNWLKYDAIDRSAFIGHLANKYISVEHLPLTYIRENILQDEFLRNCSDGMQWIVESFLDDYPIYKKPILYAFRRAEENWCCEFDIENWSLNKQKDRPAFYDFGVVKYKNYIYAVGGTVNNTRCEFGQKFHTMVKTWEEFKCDVGKSLCGVCTDKDKLYIIGGSYNDNPQNTCSYYDFKTGDLLDIPEMMTKRDVPGVVAHNSSIYALGGSSEVKPIERFDSREGKWYTIDGIQLNNWTTSVVLGNSIYSITMFGSNSNVSVFDIRNHKPSFPGHINGANSITMLNGKLYVGTSDGIEQYDHLTNTTDLILTKDWSYPVLIS